MADKEGKGDKPEGTSAQDKGPAPAASAPAAAWNPFRSRAPLPTEPSTSEAEPAAAAGGNKAATAKQARPPPAVPTDHEILTSLPSDKIWSNMQERASEGALYYTVTVILGEVTCVMNE